MIPGLEFVFFALGTFVASFVGVVSARLNTGHSFVTGRSRCDACNTPLAPHTLLPVISYFLSGGKARCCGARISLYSPITELLLGGLFVLAYQKVGLTTVLPLLLTALALLLALVLYDLMHQILPPGLLYLFVLVALAVGYTTSASTGDLQTTLVVAGFVGLFFLAMHVFSRGRAMGLADAPLALGLSAMVGSGLAFAGLAFSFWIGAVVGITILARRPRGSRMGVEVPFAPFLATGFLLAYFIIQWNPFALLTL
jgi:leader peptidase (prepilin peptidase) / N-methyltransferase